MRIVRIENIFYNEDDWAKVCELFDKLPIDGSPSEVFDQYLNAIEEGAYEVIDGCGGHEVDEDLLISMIMDQFEVDCDEACSAIETTEFEKDC